MRKLPNCSPQMHESRMAMDSKKLASKTVRWLDAKCVVRRHDENNRADKLIRDLV